MILTKNVVDFGIIATSLLTAPFSGGTSIAMRSILSSVSGIIALEDLVLENERRSLSPVEYEKTKNFYESWYQFRTAVDYASLGLSVVVGAKSILFKYSKVFNSFKNVKSTLNSIPQNLLPQLSRVWKSIKNINPQSISTLNRVSLNESKLFKGKVGLFVDNFDELLAKSQIRGFIILPIYRTSKWV